MSWKEKAVVPGVGRANGKDKPKRRIEPRNDSQKPNLRQGQLLVTPVWALDLWVIRLLLRHHDIRIGSYGTRSDALDAARRFADLVGATVVSEPPPIKPELRGFADWLGWDRP